IARKPASPSVRTVTEVASLTPQCRSARPTALTASEPPLRTKAKRVACPLRSNALPATTSKFRSGRRCRFFTYPPSKPTTNSLQGSFDAAVARASADALNCQRAIAQQIVDQDGDYALALKGNQGTLHDDVVLLLDDPECKATTAAPVVEADHGRIETRTAMVSTEIDWLQKEHQWPGLKAIGKVVRIRETPDKTTTETAYYLLSTALPPERFNEVVRQHWGVENRLHWRLDVVMNEDQDRTRLGNGPHNLAVLRHMALNAMQQEGSKGSLRGKFKRAGWDDSFLTSLLTLF